MLGDGDLRAHLVEGTGPAVGACVVEALGLEVDVRHDAAHRKVAVHLTAEPIPRRVVAADPAKIRAGTEFEQDLFWKVGPPMNRDDPSVLGLRFRVAELEDVIVAEADPEVPLAASILPAPPIVLANDVAHEGLERHVEVPGHIQRLELRFPPPRRVGRDEMEPRRGAEALVEVQLGPELPGVVSSHGAAQKLHGAGCRQHDPEGHRGPVTSSPVVSGVTTLCDHVHPCPVIHEADTIRHALLQRRALRSIAIARGARPSTQE